MTDAPRQERPLPGLSLFDRSFEITGNVVDAIQSDFRMIRIPGSGL